MTYLITDSLGNISTTQTGPKQISNMADTDTFGAINSNGEYYVIYVEDFKQNGSFVQIPLSN